MSDTLLGKVPFGSFIVAYLIQGSTAIATAPSGGLFVVPLPPAALLFGTALVGLGFLGRRRKEGLASRA